MSSTGKEPRETNGKVQRRSHGKYTRFVGGIIPPCGCPSLCTCCTNRASSGDVPSYTGTFSGISIDPSCVLGVCDFQLRPDRTVSAEITSTPTLGTHSITHTGGGGVNWQASIGGLFEAYFYDSTSPPPHSDCRQETFLASASFLLSVSYGTGCVVTVVLRASTNFTIGGLGGGLLSCELFRGSATITNPCDPAGFTVNNGYSAYTLNASPNCPIVTVRGKDGSITLVPNFA